MANEMISSRNYRVAEDRLKDYVKRECTEARRYIIFSVVHRKKSVSIDELVRYFFKGTKYIKSQSEMMKKIISKDLNAIRSRAFVTLEDKETRIRKVVIDSDGQPILGKYLGVCIVKNRQGELTLMNSSELTNRYGSWMKTISMRCLEKKSQMELAYKMQTYKNIPEMLTNMKKELVNKDFPTDIKKIALQK